MNIFVKQNTDICATFKKILNGITFINQINDHHFLVLFLFISFLYGTAYSFVALLRHTRGGCGEVSTRTILFSRHYYVLQLHNCGGMQIYATFYLPSFWMWNKRSHFALYWPNNWGLGFEVNLAIPESQLKWELKSIRFEVPWWMITISINLTKFERNKIAKMTH